MKRKLYYPIVIALAAILTATGCVSVKQDYPEKRYFALSAARSSSPTVPTSVLNKPILRIRPFRVSPAYEGRGLVYRIGDLEFTSDFYNEFLVSPGLMFTNTFREWLSDAGIFQAVIDSPSQVLPDYVLEGAVNSMYGDYRDENAPKAVIEVQLFLINASKSKSAIELQKTYKQETPIAENSPSALVGGWNRGLEIILNDFEVSLIKRLATTP